MCQAKDSVASVANKLIQSSLIDWVSEWKTALDDSISKRGSAAFNQISDA